jgi:hypothetical protein
MKPSPIPPPGARAAYAACSSATIEPGTRRFAAALLLALAAAACAGPGGVAVSDTYCRDTFYWRTSARDTEETRRQADLHNSRRLCRCASDCP